MKLRGYGGLSALIVGVVTAGCGEDGGGKGGVVASSAGSAGVSAGSAGVGAGSAGVGAGSAAGASAGTSGAGGASGSAGATGSSGAGGGASGASSTSGVGGVGGTGGMGGNAGPPYERECTADLPFECKLCDVQTTCEKPTYTVNGDGTVTSSCCGFVWQQTIEWVPDPSAFRDDCLNRPGVAGCYDFQAAQTHCASVTLAGGGFRVPTAMELVSLLGPNTVTGSRFDPVAFPDAPTTDRYWTSTPSPDRVNDAYSIGFQHTPAPNEGPKNRVHFVRCVR